MGEIAEDAIDGTTCQVCGEFMPDVIECAETGKVWTAHGHPRTCKGCGGTDAK